MPIPGFDIAFFSFDNHRDLLVPGLKSVLKHTPEFNDIILVWDDYVRKSPIDFDQIQDQIGHKITVIKHTDLDPWPKKIGCWGWIKQQLVKLRCFEYSSTEYTWIVDGDVLLTGNPELFIDNKPVLRYDQERIVNTSTSEYHHFIQKYFGIEDFIRHTWVGSTCLFDNNICREIWEYCLSRNHKTLTECVEETISNITDTHLHWPFSEFELYGSYCKHFHPDKFYMTEKNWNYAPRGKKLDMPIQIMWHAFDQETKLSILKGHN